MRLCLFLHLHQPACCQLTANSCYALQTRAAISAADLAGKAATLTTLLRRRAGGGGVAQGGLLQPEGPKDAAALQAGA